MHDEIVWITLPFEDLRYKRRSAEDIFRDQKRHKRIAEQKASEYSGPSMPAHLQLGRDRPEHFTPTQRREMIIAYLLVGILRYETEQRNKRS